MTQENGAGVRARGCLDPRHGGCEAHEALDRIEHDLSRVVGLAMPAGPAELADRVNESLEEQAFALASCRLAVRWGGPKLAERVERASDRCATAFVERVTKELAAHARYREREVHLLELLENMAKHGPRDWAARLEMILKEFKV